MRDFLKGMLKFLLGVAVVVGVIGGVLYGFFIRKVDVGHNAMAPTIMAGDSVLVWKTNEFELGEVALCPHPEIAGRYVMARVMARSGQMIAIDRGILYISGSSPDTDLHDPITFNDVETGRSVQMVWAEEDMLDHEHKIFYLARTGVRPLRERRVEGGYFLLSDNRTYRGEDSRSFGPIMLHNCIGRVFMRLTAAESPPEIGNQAFDLIE